MYCVILVFEIAFIAMFFPETSGRTLEELAFLFEDKALTEEANKAALKAADQPHVATVEAREEKA